MTTQLGWTFDPDKPVYQKRDNYRSRRSLRDGWLCQAILWARSILCPWCNGLIPLSPHWRLDDRQALGIHLLPNPGLKIVGFEVAPSSGASAGTVKKGIATCPLCGGTTPKGYPAQEARAERMGHLEYCQVWRQYWLEYRRAGKRPIQRRNPHTYLAPAGHEFFAIIERQRALNLKGLPLELEKDPSLLTLGLYGGTPSEFAPGLAYQFGGDDGYREWLAATENGWETEGEETPPRIYCP